jgi:chaperonin GroES
MNVRPLHDRIIVRRFTESAEKHGSIIIPDSAKEKPQLGEVLAAGLGKSNDEGERVALDGVEYLIMKEEDVLAIQEVSA